LNKLVTTSDGSHTIYVPELDEHYHSVHGAVQESEHIFIKSGFDFCQANPLFIFEVGFGTGLNALLTAVNAAEGSREVFYTSFEKYPLDENIFKQLNHHNFGGERGREIASRINSSAWGRMNNICPNFNLEKIEGDITQDEIKGRYNLIYFDAFGPDKQPEMWTMKIFEKISNITEKNGILITYSSKGDVKRNLRSAGFKVVLIPGPPGKREITRAIKI
jgi:tRNA U34 5-methylaminomethyl-2-thiouridine-forming methyltransferase MnmC